MNRELLFSTLYNRLTAAPLVFGFLADTNANDPVLFNVNDMSGLAVGMPVFLPNVPDGTFIQALTPNVTLSNPATAAQTQVEVVQGFRTFGRRLQPWVKTPNQPALFVINGRDEEFPGLSSAPGRQSSVPAMVTLHAEAWVYARTADLNVTPDTLLNAMLDGISEALDPPPTSPTGMYQNLGISGVLHARIEGAVRRWGGHGDGQAVAIVPIVIRAVQGVTMAPLP